MECTPVYYNSVVNFLMDCIWVQRNIGGVGTIMTVNGQIRKTMAEVTGSKTDMQQNDRTWAKPELKFVGTLRDVAGSANPADQSGGNQQGVGNSKS